MKIIFQVEKTRSQIDNPKWSMYLGISCLMIFVWIFRDHLQPPTLGIILFMGIWIIIRKKSDSYLVIRDEGIVFRNKNSVWWSIKKDNLKSMEYNLVNFYGLNPTKKLVSLFFKCNDGDSYSIATSYFSEQQAKEILVAIDQLKELN